MSKKKERKKMMNATLAAWKEALLPHLFDLDRMENRNVSPVSALLKMVHDMPNGTVGKGKDGEFGFIDRGSDILAVAHLDATGHAPHFGKVVIGGHTWILSRWIDDRLGVFLLLDVLAKFLDYDILLCTGEEQGKSTSFHFKPPEGKEYKWMFELDRMGDDVVHYQYDDAAWLKALRASGFNRILRGSYTDIVDLEHLGICGVNIAIGYTDNHSDWAKANLSVTLEQVARFCMFYEANREIAYPFTPPAKKVYVPKAGGQANGKTTGVWPGHSESFLGREGSSKFRSYGYGAEYDPPAWAPAYIKGEIIRLRSTGNFYEVESSAYWTAAGYKMSVFRHNGTARAFVYAFIEDVESLWDEDEIAEAKKVFPDGLYPMSITVVKGEKANANDAAAYQELLRIADGECWKEPTLRAREKIEKSYAGTTGIKYHSSQYGRREYRADGPRYSNKVQTPLGEAHIDSYHPVVLNTGSSWWWVRYGTPDTSGHVCALVPEEEISLIPTILRLPSPKAAN